MPTQNEILINAIKRKDVNAIIEALEKGADPNAKDDQGVPALHLAVDCKDITVVKPLLERGADVNMTDEDQSSALHRVATNGTLDIALLLIKYGAQWNIKNKEEITPRAKALLHGHTTVAELFKLTVDNHHAERLSLRKDILSLTAGEDVVSSVNQKIKALLSDLQERNQTAILKVIEKCIQPEKLLTANNLEISSTTLNEKSVLFGDLNLLLESLASLCGDLSQSNKSAEKEALLQFKKLISFYEDFRAQIIHLAPAERLDYCQVKHSVRLVGIDKEFYYLHPWVYERFLSAKKGEFTKEREDVEKSSHVVIRLFGNFYKLAPDDPSREDAVAHLANTLTGQGCAPTELIMLATPDDPESAWLTIMASKAVKGPSFQDVLLQRKELIEKINPYNFSMHFTLTALTEFDDGKPDNYRLRLIEDDEGNIVDAELVGIDNDLAFNRTLVRDEKYKTHWIRLRSIIFCLSQHMQKPIDPVFRAELLHNHPANLMLIWLRNLLIQEKRYQSYGTVLSAEELTDLHLPPKFQAGTLSKIYQKLVIIQRELASNSQITHAQLLFKIDPLMAKYYEHVLSANGNDPLKAMRYIYDCPPLEIVLKDYPNLEQELQPHTLTNRECDKARTQSLQAACEELINQLNFKEMPEVMQNDVFRRIAAHFNFLPGLKINQANALHDKHLEELGSGLTHLNSLTLQGCPQVSSKGISAILNFHPECTITLEDFSGMSAHDLLITAQHSKKFVLVIENKPYIVARNNIELLTVALRINQENLLTFVLAYGIHLAHDKFNELSPLYIAISEGRMDVVKQLLFYGVPLNQFDGNNQTPLDTAYFKYQQSSSPANEKYLAILIELIAHGAYDCGRVSPENILQKVIEYFIKQADLSPKLQTALFNFAFTHKLLNPQNLSLLINKERKHVSLCMLEGRELVEHPIKDGLITALLQHVTGLQSVDFSGCSDFGIQELERLSDGGVKDIYLTFSQARACKLTDENQLASLNSIKFKNILIHIVRIGHFDLSRKVLSTNQLSDLAKALKTNQTLLHLELWKCSLDAAKFKLIMDGLGENKILEVLNLEHNKIGDVGITFLAPWLKNHSKLRKLSLDHNEIMGAGIECLSEVLSEHGSLKSLKLHKNNVGNRGAVALANMLQKNSSLTDLDINETNIQSYGGCQIVSALSGNTTLIKLDIGYNENLDDVLGRQLLVTFKLNKTLVHLKMRGIKLSAVLVKEIEKAIKHNVDQQIETRLSQKHTQRFVTEYQMGSLVSQFSLVTQSTKSTGSAAKPTVEEEVHFTQTNQIFRG